MDIISNNLSTIIIAIVYAIFITILLIRVNNIRKEKGKVEKELECANSAYRRITLENTNLKKQLSICKENNTIKTPKVIKKALILQPCSTDVLKGDLHFRRSDNRKLVENGTVTVTIQKGRLQKVYISNRKNKVHTKVPIIISTKR